MSGSTSQKSRSMKFPDFSKYISGNFQFNGIVSTGHIKSKMDKYIHCKYKNFSTLYNPG